MSKHATITELEAGSYRRVFILAVSGLGHRYVSHPGVATATIPGTSDTYTDVEAIVHVGTESWAIDPVGGITTHRPIAIKLASAGKNATAETDPLMTFGRVGSDAASWSTIVTESVTQAATTIKINSDPSVLTFPTYLHVGGETVEATAGAGSDADPDDADPYRLTVVRGIANTVPQRHTVETYQGVKTSEQPEVTAEIVAWRTRRAILYIAAGRADGSISEPVEYMRGVIDRTPEPAEDGLSCTIDLVPYTGLLDVEVPSLGQSTELVDTHHYFAAGRATTLSYEVAWDRGVLIKSEVTADAGSTDEVVEVLDTTPHEELADLTLDDAHPRRGALRPHKGSDQPNVLPIGYTGGDYDVDALDGAVSIGPLYNQPTREGHEAQLAARDWSGVLAEWPAALVSARGDFTPGTVDGLSGAWFDMGISWETGTPLLNVVPNWSSSTFSIGRPRLRFRFGGALQFPDGEFGAPAENWSSGAPAALTTGGALAWYPVDMAAPDDPTFQDTSLQPPDGSVTNKAERVVHLEIAQGGQRQQVPIRGICTGGWYQTGERFMLVTDDLPVPASGMGTVLLTFVDPLGNEHVSMARYTSSTAKATGYALEMGNPYHVPSVGNWPGRQRTRIEPAIFLDGTPGDVLLMLLTSSGGQGINGTYDTLVGGAALTEDDLDIESFERLRFPSTVARWQQLVRDGDKLSSIITAILQLTGTILGMARTDDGRCVLRVMRTGASMDIESRGTITAGDWAGAPSWSTDDEIINRVAFTFDQGEDGKSQREIQFNSGKSQKAHGEVKAIEIDLPGVKAPSSQPNAAVAMLRGPAQSIFRIMKDPRYVWRGMIHTGAALFAQPGAVYTVSSPDLRDSDGWGITSKTARVSSAEIQLWSEGANVELTRYPGRVTGWNASGYVATTPTADSITIDANRYSGTRHPFSGASQKDIDGFAAGDVVLYEPAGNNDGETSHTIDSIDRATNTITFTAAHGMAVGGHIVPARYDSATAAHKAMAYLSDANGRLGAANDVGYRFA